MSVVGHTGQFRRRHSARVILLDEHDRLLLIRFAVERQGRTFVFWATPGGSLEPGEAPLDAARREVEEELGLRLSLTGPIHQTQGRFEHENEMVDNTDFFFLGRCKSTDPSLGWMTEDERKAMQEMRWWTVEEVESSVETFFPPDLPSLIRASTAT